MDAQEGLVEVGSSYSPRLLMVPANTCSYSSRKLLAPDGRFYTWKKKFWRNSFEVSATPYSCPSCI